MPATAVPRPMGDMVYNHIVSLAAVHFARTHERRRKIVTAEQAQAYAESIRARFRRLLNLPEIPRTPLRARTTARFERAGYTVENVIFESRPGLCVTANLYLPSGLDRPVPGILHALGHKWDGKAAEPYQRASIALVRSGFAVLAYDPVGQGERVQYWDPLLETSRIARNPYAIAVAEHEYAGMQSLLVGVSMGGLMVWDAMRALDYLAGRPEVDPERLGCTGVSGGGVITAYLTALDPRVRAAAPICYVTTRERWLRRNEFADAEQVQDDVIKEGIDHAELCVAALPRPVLIGTATRDFFPIEGAREAFAFTRQIYALHGAAERVGLAVADSEHGFQPEHRKAVVQWFRRWLGGETDPAAQDPGCDAVIEPGEALAAAPKGQVFYLGSRNVFHFTRERALALRRERANPFAAPGEPEQFRAAQASLGSRLRALLRLDAIEAGARGDAPVPRDVGRCSVRRDGCVVSELIFETEPGIRLRAALVEPEPEKRGASGCTASAAAGRRRGGHRGVVCVSEAPYEAVLAPGGPADFLLHLNGALLVVEMRGMGAVPSEPCKMAEGYRRMGVEGYHFYNYGMVGRNLLGCRVWDTWVAIRCLRQVAGIHGDVHLYGQGAAGVVALFAAALDPSVAGVRADGAVISYEALPTSEYYHPVPGIWVPGILQVCDLPDVAACVAPRPLELCGIRDASGRLALPADALAAYAPLVRVYEAFGATERLRLGEHAHARA